MAGAGLINAIFLPRASAVIEIRPLGFDATHAFTWPRWFEKRLQYFHELMYFSICIYDKDLSAKGPLEGDTSGTNVVATTRDRSVILPPAYLFAVLDEFRSFGGNMSLYDGAATTKLCTSPSSTLPTFSSSCLISSTLPSAAAVNSTEAAIRLLLWAHRQ